MQTDFYLLRRPNQNQDRNSEIEIFGKYEFFLEIIFANQSNE